MITLDGIYENIIVEVLIIGGSFLISKFFPTLMGKKEPINKEHNFDILKLAIFLTSIAILNLILNLSFWNNQQLTILFTLLSMGFGIATVYIYNNQCPACKKFIGAKKIVDSKIIREFKKEIPYQPMKVWKFSNGRIKRKEPFGKKKIRTEKWQTKQEFYECNHCKTQWDSGQMNVPLVIEKESHIVINTNERDPDEPSLY